MAYDAKMDHHWHPSKSVMIILVGLSLTVWFWADVSLKNQQMKSVGKQPLERHMITVSAEGKVLSKPDIATVEIGITTDAAKVSEAQQKNTEKFNAMLVEIKALGVAEDDIQTTSYSIYPKYEYTNNSSRLVGYTVSQQVTVKIRNLAIAGDVLDKSGQSGANNVSGLSFKIDEPTKLEEQARSEAIMKAKEKALRLGKEVGFTLGKLVNFSEATGGATPPPIYYDKAYALGSAPMAAPSPSIQPGSTEIISNVSLTYEIE